MTGHGRFFPVEVTEIRMDVGSATGIARLATAMSQEQLAQDIGVAVLKKAIDVQAAGALALIAAIPAPSNLPAHIGQGIDTTA